MYSSRKIRKQEPTLQKFVDPNAPLHCQLTSTLLMVVLLTAEGLCSVPRSVQLLDLPKMLRVLLMNQEAGLPGRCRGSSPSSLPCRAGVWSPAPSLLPRRSSQPQSTARNMLCMSTDPQLVYSMLFADVSPTSCRNR